MGEDLSNRIKAVRLAMKMTQQEFGARLGVTRDVICNMERSRARPRQALLKHICDCYGVGEEWLFRGTGEMFPHDQDAEPPQKLLQEAMSLFANLTPSHQEYALQQIRGLLKLQQEQEK